jgi:hypothetical protein
LYLKMSLKYAEDKFEVIQTLKRQSFYKVQYAAEEQYRAITGRVVHYRELFGEIAMSNEKKRDVMNIKSQVPLLKIIQLEFASYRALWCITLLLAWSMFDFYTSSFLQIDFGFLIGSLVIISYYKEQTALYNEIFDSVSNKNSVVVFNIVGYAMSVTFLTITLGAKDSAILDSVDNVALYWLCYVMYAYIELDPVRLICVTKWLINLLALITGLYFTIVYWAENYFWVYKLNCTFILLSRCVFLALTSPEMLEYINWCIQFRPDAYYSHKYIKDIVPLSLSKWRTIQEVICASLILTGELVYIILDVHEAIYSPTKRQLDSIYSDVVLTVSGTISYIVILTIILQQFYSPTWLQNFLDNGYVQLQ